MTTTDITITITEEVGNALCLDAGYLELKPEHGAWINPETGDRFATTHDALLKALPQLAEQLAELPAPEGWSFIEEAEDLVRQAALEAEQGDHHPADLENGPSASDIPDEDQQAIDDMAAIAKRAYPIGSRVKFKHDVDRWPHFVVGAGATGTVAETGDATQYAVKLDRHHEGAEEWSNEIRWDLAAGEYPGLDLETTIDYDVVLELRASTDDELVGILVDGGPVDLCNAAQAELDRRGVDVPARTAEMDQARGRYEAHRKADSIYHDEWDANGTISVYLPQLNWRPWLEARGWKFLSTGRWLSPTGDGFWNIDEVMSRQLVAEQLLTQEVN